MNLGLVAVLFCGGIIHFVNPYRVLPILGWRKFAGYNRLMLLLCQRKRLQSLSCCICGYMSLQTRKICLLTYQRRWRGASSFTKKFSLAVESFWYSPRNSALFCISFLELLHSMNIVREKDAVLLKYSVNGLMAESRPVWTGGKRLFLGLLPITPLIAALV